MKDYIGWISGIRFIGQGGDGPNPPVIDLSLSSLGLSVVWDIDATVVESEPLTGDTIYNLVPHPSDGSRQSDYNFKIDRAAVNNVSTSGIRRWNRLASTYLQNNVFRTQIAKPFTKQFIKQSEIPTGSGVWTVHCVNMSASVASRTRNGIYGGDTSSPAWTCLNFGTSNGQNIRRGEMSGSGTSTNLSSTIIPSNRFCLVITQIMPNNQVTTYINGELVGNITLPLRSANPIDSTFAILDMASSSTSASYTRIVSAAIGQGVLTEQNIIEIQSFLEQRQGVIYQPISEMTFLSYIEDDDEEDITEF